MNTIYKLNICVFFIQLIRGEMYRCTMHGKVIYLNCGVEQCIIASCEPLHSFHFGVARSHLWLKSRNTTGPCFYGLSNKKLPLVVVALNVQSINMFKIWTDYSHGIEVAAFWAYRLFFFICGHIALHRGKRKERQKPLAPWVRSNWLLRKRRVWQCSFSFILMEHRTFFRMAKLCDGCFFKYLFLWSHERKPLTDRD